MRILSVNTIHHLLLAVLLTFFTFSCEQGVISQLRPETVDFLTHQEQARCTCLDQHGERFLTKMDEGITFIKQLPNQYNLDSIGPKEIAIIKGGMAGFESNMIMVMQCINNRTSATYQSNQLDQMLIAEDLRVVLQLDSSKTESERIERLNKPSLELMDEYCPQHKDVLLKMQEFLKVAEILPEGLK